MTDAIPWTLAACSVAAAFYAHVRVGSAIRKMDETQREFTTVFNNLMKAQGEMQPELDAAVEMKRLLPALREALIQFRAFNQTY